MQSLAREGKISGMQLLQALLLLPILLCGASAQASLYFEVGTGLGSFKSADGFFGQSTSSKNGFSGSFSAYLPVTRENRLAHLDLGLQNRITSATSLSDSPLALGSINLAARVEIWRFYVGGGYSPMAFVSNSGGGIMGLHTHPGNSSYFAEAGAIWKIIPEFQIVAAASLEYGQGKVGSSPSPLTEYGLRFRFPLNPTQGGTQGVDFDGFRYPFGFMK